MARVLRILSAVACLAVVTAGCGGAAQPQKLAVHGVPQALASDWERRASAIASAAAAGNNCNAQQLANALRSDVIKREHKLPLRLRAPLLTGVNSLAERIRCVVTVPTPPQKPPKPPPKPPHEHHGHGPGHDHGGGDGGGNDQ
jgi:hypothetical protein